MRTDWYEQLTMQDKLFLCDMLNIEQGIKLTVASLVFVDQKKLERALQARIDLMGFNTYSGRLVKRLKVKIGDLNRKII